MTAQPRPKPGALTGRELDILRLLADGLSNIEIGVRLSRSELTVKSHLHRMSLKLGTGDRAGMVAAGFRTGLLRVPGPVVQAPAALPDDVSAALVVVARALVAGRPLGDVRQLAKHAVALADGAER